MAKIKEPKDYQKDLYIPEVKLTQVDIIDWYRIPIIQSSQEAVEVFNQYIIRKNLANQININEFAFFLYLNNNGKVLGITNHSIGGIGGTVIDFRLVFAQAILLNATGMIAAHNHPSGNLTASPADERMAKQMQDAGKIMEIKLLDFLILTSSNGYYSFKDNYDIIFEKGGEIEDEQEFAYGGVVPKNSFREIEDANYFSYYFVNKGVLWNVLIVWGKYNYVSVTKKSNNPFGGIIGKDFDNVSAAVDYYKDANIKSNIIFAADEAKKYGYEFAFAKGGRVGYEKLVKKVAASYEGKPVPSKYQPKYGKRYHADEAKQVGYAVATKVYGKPLARMADGGVVNKFNQFGLYTDEYIKQISKEASEKISDGYLASKYGEDITKLKPWHIESLRQIFYKDCIQKSKDREEQINMENEERSERGVQAMLDWLDEYRADRTDEEIKKEFMFNANRYAERLPLLYPEYAEGGETDSEITAEDRMIAQQHNYKFDL